MRRGADTARAAELAKQQFKEVNVPRIFAVHVEYEWAPYCLYPVEVDQVGIYFIDDV